MRTILKKRCFKCGEINLFFRLSDVLKIIGVSINGKPIIEKNVDGRALCDEYLRTTEPFQVRKAGMSLI